MYIEYRYIVSFRKVCQREHKVRIFTEYYSVCPLIGIGIVSKSILINKKVVQLHVTIFFLISPRWNCKDDIIQGLPRDGAVVHWRKFRGKVKELESAVLTAKKQGLGNGVELAISLSILLVLLNFSSTIKIFQTYSKCRIMLLFMIVLQQIYFWNFYLPPRISVTTRHKRTFFCLLIVSLYRI